MQEGHNRKAAWETYYAFYNRDIATNTEIMLRVAGNGISYDKIVGKQYITDYNSIVTLDFSRQTITAGKCCLDQPFWWPERTGGLLVPEDLMQDLYRRGKELL